MSITALPAPAGRIHHPSCEPSACSCPPAVGATVTVDGLSGRWRVMKAATDVVIVARAGRVEALYGPEVALVRSEP